MKGDAGALLYIMMVLAGITVLPVSVRGQQGSQPGCEYTILSQSVSPDGKWSALVEQAICGNGAFTTTVTNAVRLVQSDTAPLDEGIVLVVDVGGDVNAQPIVGWETSEVLHISVPTGALIGRKEQKYEQVAVEIDFR